MCKCYVILEMKKCILFILISSLIGCKTYKTDFDKTSNSFTIQATEDIGGKYQLANENEFYKLTDKLFLKTSAILNKKSSEIILLDLYINETNYIWYAGLIENEEIYRFISDKSMENISFEKVERTKIKEELINLKN